MTIFLRLNIICHHSLSPFDGTFDQNVFISDFKLSQSVSWIDWDGVVNLKRFAERVEIFLNGLDFSEFVFDVNFILVRNYGKKTFFIVLNIKVAA